MKIRVRYRSNTGEVKHGITRAFGIGFTLLAMLTAALVGALLTMRVAIHAGEVTVPNLSGLTLDEASDQTHDGRLNLTVDNRFYSTTVPAGRVLSQSPAAGTRVRKGWHMRITESIGPQKVAIPDTIGMDQRDAASAIRRASLDLGTLAHLPAPGPADAVLAQTPAPNAEGVDKPEVSLLLSQPIESAPHAWVMPNLVGLSFPAARARMKELNLSLYAIVPQSAPPAALPNADGTPGVPTEPAAPVTPSGPVVSQSPQAGARVTAGDNPHVTMTRSYTAPAASASLTPEGTAGSNAAGTPPRPAATAPAAAPVRQQPPAPVIRVAPAPHL